MLYRMKEDYPPALAHSQEAEKLARKIGHKAGIARTLHEQGIIFNQMDRSADALERFRESLEIKRRIGDESGVADSLGELGKLLRNAGQMREAIAAFTEALGIFQRQGSSKMGISLSMLGEIHERQGEYTAALEKYQQARLIYQQAMPVNLPIIERKIARVREKMGGGGESTARLSSRRSRGRGKYTMGRPLLIPPKGGKCRSSLATWLGAMRVWLPSPPAQPEPERV